AWSLTILTGTFNHKEKVWLVLWEAKVIIEIPPGIFLFYPSAVFTHFNCDISAGRETRSNNIFTHFSAGGLFRWVECGYRTQKEFLAAGGTFAKNGSHRWLDGVGLYSTWAQLKARMRQA
ncbi:hypothetical protein C8T65DRAFT_563960, partial [Cerioporus squamosus]